jgi:hypothetical protein
MKWKHKGGTISVNKKLLASYSEEQLMEFAENNGIDAEDTVKLKERVGSVEEDDAPAPKVNKKKKP